MKSRSPESRATPQAVESLLVIGVLVVAVVLSFRGWSGLLPAARGSAMGAVSDVQRTSVTTARASRLATAVSQAGNVQAGNVQAGNVQAGNVQAGNVQAGNVQAGNVQAGNVQAGNVQAGNAQTGNAQTGNAQAGNAQTGGTPHPTGVPTPARSTGGAIGPRATPAPASPPPNSRPPAASSSSPCGRTKSHPATWAHVIWIWMENRSYGDVVGSAAAPFENHTLMAECGLAENYHNVSHPSLPNYLAATSGETLVTSDCSPSRCSQGVNNLFTQLQAAGKTWRSYEESMPSNCDRSDSGLYSAHHNPAVYYRPAATACQRWDVPLGGRSAGAFADDLTHDRLPNFAFVTPNECDDMHSCPVRSGDAWLAYWIPRIVDSPAYRSGNTVVIVTWDEGSTDETRNCAHNATAHGCHVPTFVIAPSTPQGARSRQLFNHYGLLKTTEQLLGLHGFLGQAASASNVSLRAAFNI